MLAIKIDTLEMARELEEAGVPKKQAEAQTRVYAKMLDMAVEGDLVTKQDLQKEIYEVKTELRKEIHEVKDSVNERIHHLEVTMTKQTTKVVSWMATFISLAVATLSFLIKFLH